MRWGVVALLCIAACGGSGVDLDIFVPDGVKVDRVEVWVGYGQCGTSDCPDGIAWTSSARTQGDIYFLEDERLIAAEQQGDRWVLHLDVAKGLADPTTITFVGFDGDKVSAVEQLNYPHVPVAHVEIWQIYLHPADIPTMQLTTAPADPTRDRRALVWVRQPTPDLAAPQSCLIYQNWDGSRWDTDFVVPKSDPDCDGFAPDKECNDFWFQYKNSGGCVTDQLLAGTCVLGTSTCEDGVSNDRTCSHEPSGITSCVPDVFCAKCGDQIPAEACAPAAARDAHVDNTLFHYDCAVDATTEGTNCLDQHVQVVLPSGGTRACSTVAVHYIDKPFSEPQTQLVYGTAPIVKVTPALNKTTGNPCVVDLYWFGNASVFNSGLVFIVEVGYDNNTRAFYPIEMKRSSQPILCTQVMLRECVQSGPANDGVSACAALP